MKVNLKDYTGRRLHLVDVSAVARTKWWNFKDLSWTVEGEKVGTGAIFAVLSLVKEIPLNDRIIFCFDYGGNLRKEDYDGYKGNRTKADSDYYVQVNTLRDLLMNCGFEVLGQSGYEADDFIVGAAKHYYDDYDNIFVYTNDNDLAQLVDNKTILKKTRTKQSDITIENYVKELGVPYNSITLFKAIVGDPSDNIKGIPRFGPKKFEKFIQEVSKQYNLTEIRNKDLEKSIILGYDFKQEDRQAAMESLRVVLPRIPNEYHFEETNISPDTNMLAWYIERYGMKSLIKYIH